jgi:hypothetical protein
MIPVFAVVLIVMMPMPMPMPVYSFLRDLFVFVGMLAINNIVTHVTMH